ncbi:MAG: flagellar protein export ATPase FliI [Firmicutes bacterium]|nr:flagellar protein export ATPase FliI [Bacillota bacterium]
MKNRPLEYQKYLQVIDAHPALTIKGRVTQVIGLVMEVSGIRPYIGEVCLVKTAAHKEKPVLAEAVGFRQDRSLLMPLGDLRGMGPGCSVEATGSSFLVRVGSGILGQVLDGLGRPLQEAGNLGALHPVPVENEPPHPLQRKPITETMETGVRAIDTLLTCGQGQRIGIFSGSGVGKSTLLGMIARYSAADVNVIALVGERGREVGEFLRQDLGAAGLKRSVVVVSTSERPAMERVKAALVATAVAEYFREQGLKVILMMDSLTRFAMALREIGLAIGEPPTTKGYTPSVFATLPKLLERSGTARQGSITGFYTVLVDGDDFNEPIADAVRGILDGHIILSRELAARNHFPSIDVLGSVSRLMPQLIDAEHKKQAAEVKELLAVYRETEDLINIGAYVQGSNPRVDRAITYRDKIRAFLCQDQAESVSWRQSRQALQNLLAFEN